MSEEKFNLNSPNPRLNTSVWLEMELTLKMLREKVSQEVSNSTEIEPPPVIISRKSMTLLSSLITGMLKTILKLSMDLLNGHSLLTLLKILCPSNSLV